jgi:hypothetical protein
MVPIMSLAPVKINWNHRNLKRVIRYEESGKTYIKLDGKKEYVVFVVSLQGWYPGN